MRFRPPKWNPALALGLGVTLLAVAALLAALRHGGEREQTATTAATTAPPTTTAPPQVQAPALWDLAGAFVWHETAVDPTILGRTLRDAGFRWLALHVHDGLSVDPVEPSWIERFRAASGLSVGGWGNLRDDPEDEAALASRLVAEDGLDFYVANAEAEYALTVEGAQDPVRYGRSRRFVDAFRALRPDLPAAISSYCRADRQDLDWGAWRDAGFDFLPQAYVNQHGPDVAPAICAEAAAGAFPPARVHPTIGTYAGPYPTAPEEWGRMLAAAGTQGFSIYPAEASLPPERIAAYAPLTAE